MKWRKSAIWVADDFLSLENPGSLILSKLIVICNPKRSDQHIKCEVQCCKGLVSSKPRMSLVSKTAFPSTCQMQLRCNQDKMGF